MIFYQNDIFQQLLQKSDLCHDDIAVSEVAGLGLGLVARVRVRVQSSALDFNFDIGLIIVI